jgi:hypothetical protein
MLDSAGSVFTVRDLRTRFRGPSVKAIAMVNVLSPPYCARKIVLGKFVEKARVIFLADGNDAHPGCLQLTREAAEAIPSTTHRLSISNEAPSKQNAFPRNFSSTDKTSAG